MWGEWNFCDEKYSPQKTHSINILFGQLENFENLYMNFLELMKCFKDIWKLGESMKEAY